MTWFKVDDGFHCHPKVLAVSLTARGLWVTAGSYVSDHRGDGFIPTALVKLHRGTNAAKELVKAGLWSETDGGYLVHDWLDYQPSREEEEKRSADRRSKARAAATARWGGA